MQASIPGLLVVVSLLASAVAQADPTPDELLGRYWLPKRNGQIAIYRSDDAYHGRVVCCEVPDQLDVRNADPELRNRRFVIDMLKGFDYDTSEARWHGGTIYDARSGKTYDARLWFEGRDRRVLFARGFVGTPFFGRTERFERVSPAELSEVVAGPQNAEADR